MAITVNVLFLCLIPMSTLSELIIYPHSDDSRIPQSDKFRVFLAQSSAPRQESFVYNTTSDHRVAQFAMDNGKKKFTKAIPGRSVSWTSFAFSGTPVTVTVTTHTDFSSCLVRPQRYVIPCRRTGPRRLSFVVSRNSSMMSVELDSDQGGRLKDITHKLLIFADPPENDVPAGGESGVLRYDVGYHDLRGQLTIPPGITEVYLAPGAFVEGGFISTPDSSIRIHGRGIIDNKNFPWRDESFNFATINLDGGQGHVVEGITLVDSMRFFLRSLSASNTVRNIKTVGAWSHNNDGVALGLGGVMTDSFIHANDDSIKLYYSQMRVERCVVWQAQNGAVFQFGWWPTRAIHHVTVNAIDVIHVDWCTFKPNRCHLSRNKAIFNLGPRTLRVDSSDLTFNDVRVEGLCPRVFNFPLDPPTTGTFNDVTFANWAIESLQPGTRNVISGSKGVGRGRLEHWAFVNFTVAGACISNPRQANIDIDRTTTRNMSFTCL